MWRVTPGQALRLRQFDDGYVLYNDLSGDTHLLADSAIDLLAALQLGPASSAALCEALAGAMERVRDPGFDIEVEALLAQLSAFFLVEAVP